MLATLCITAAASVLFFAIRNGIGPVPTSRKVRKAVLESLPQTPAGTVVYELGAGWGSLLFPLSRSLPHCTLIGIENSPLPFLWCWLRCKLGRHHNVKIVYANIYRADLRAAAGVVCYLYPGAMKKLETKFQEELPRGCWVLSHTFALPTTAPLTTLEASDLYRSKVYVYRLAEKETRVINPTNKKAGPRGPALNTEK